MEMKTRTKFILAFITMLVAMCLFNVGTVNAVEVTEDYIQNMLDVLPDTIKIGVSQSDNFMHEMDEQITKNIEEIWKNNGIDIQEVKAQRVYFSIGNSAGKQAYVNIRNANREYEKTMKLTLDGHSKYNSADEQAVKSLNIKLPNYLTIGFNKCDSWDEINKVVENYYNNSVNDKSIHIGLFVAAGGGDIVGLGYGESGVYIGTFKNGVLYDCKRLGCIPVVPEIIIPDNVNDTEQDYINYAKPLIVKYMKENRANMVLNADNITLTKGGTVNYYHYNGNLGAEKTFNVENGYTVTATTDIGEEKVAIILKKAKSTPVASTVTKEDTTTGIKIETTTNIISSNVVLTSTTVTDQNILNTVKGALKEISTKYMVYDINLLENNVKVQPNGKLKVSIPIPSDYNKEKLEVYRIEDNGDKIKYDVTVEGDYATFETDHFSTYVLAENTAQGNSTSKEKDDTPKTGTIDNIYFLVPIAVISTLGAVIFERKERNGLWK